MDLSTTTCTVLFNPAGVEIKRSISLIPGNSMSLQFGDLTKKLPLIIKGRIHWQCLCRCGNITHTSEHHLHSGHTKSCGNCNYAIKHPKAYSSWKNMYKRCTNPNAEEFPRYGGRGIKVCSEWNRFINFLDDMGDPPTDAITGDRYTLDRKDNNLGYFKDNCRWASRVQQQNNMSSNILWYKRKLNLPKTTN